MSNAIGITVRKAEENDDPAAGKFFGAPTLPMKWVDTFDEDEIFFCQIRLADIAALDKEHRLPHTGYLYVFLRTEAGPYRLQADVRYYDGEPDTVVEGFNAATDYARFAEAWLMKFAAAEETDDGIKLFGVPADWSYAEDPPPLLMQYDPLASKMGFLDHLDGYVYLFFGEDTADFNKVTLMVEYS